MSINHAQTERYNRLVLDHQEVLAANDQLLKDRTAARREVIQLQEANSRLQIETRELKRKLADIKSSTGQRTISPPPVLIPKRPTTPSLLPILPTPSSSRTGPKPNRASVPPASFRDPLPVHHEFIVIDDEDEPIRDANRQPTPEPQPTPMVGHGKRKHTSQQPTEEPIEVPSIPIPKPQLTIEHERDSTPPSQRPATTEPRDRKPTPAPQPQSLRRRHSLVAAPDAHLAHPSESPQKKPKIEFKSKPEDDVVPALQLATPPSSAMTSPPPPAPPQEGSLVDEIRSLYLGDVQPLTIQHAEPVIVSRKFIHARYGGSRFQFVQAITFEGSKRHLVFPLPEFNPCLPTNPGASGFIFASRHDTVSHFPWGVFIKDTTRSGKEAVYKYMGEYKSEVVGLLTAEEFCRQSEKEKRTWANLIFKQKAQQVYARMRARIALRKHCLKVTEDSVLKEVLRIKSSNERDPPLDITPDEILDAFCRGDERIDILRMKCVEYDFGFARDMSTEYPKWKTSEAKVDGSSKSSVTRRSLVDDDDVMKLTPEAGSTRSRRSSRVRKSSEKAMWQDDVDMSDLTDIGSDDDDGWD